ncbi:mannose/fructose/N-acetylgalactosamine-specific phosphotransferase system component IIC [Breznakia pachnodae]|uniref:Mannose/fructose/N-acetylgalactosamine-specific phosphotransferase system component IIC n=1 Tax=Breznakia pachnodae TaxID=265178 RepID=A0ABU0E0X9_9FIRM|nr:mannose/fructose/N-acetylgalactosamine-specific phosphotransferase system component IIC [Breznakia pachnodae]
MAGSFWLHRIEKYVEQGKFKSVYNTVLIGNFFGGRILIANVLPIILYLVLGSVFINDILGVIPQELITGLSTAGKVLPALGMAILLKYLPLKGNFQYLILGFVLFSYVNLPILAIALIGVVIAVTIYHNLEKEAKMSVTAGGIGDE